MPMGIRLWKKRAPEEFVYGQGHLTPGEYAHYWPRKRGHPID